MQHRIAIYAIVLCIASLHRTNGTTEIALFLQNVIKLQRYRKSLAFEEALTQLCVPYKFIGIHRIVVISSTAILVNVGSQASTPRKIHCCITTISELPRIKITLTLEKVPRMSIIHRTVNCQFKPAITETCRKLFTQLGCLSRILLRIGISIKSKLSDIIIIPDICKRTYGPMPDRIQGCIKHECS